VQKNALENRFITHGCEAPKFMFRQTFLLSCRKRAIKKSTQTPLHYQDQAILFKIGFASS
jgi:hypothetical protein